jgi:thiosulfate/3-mercaptopyruvate sulfurtransferase
MIRTRPGVLAPLILLIGLLSPAPGHAQAGDLLVSAEWLAAHADDPDLVLLHVGPEEGFATEHIAGAVLITRDDFSDPGSHSPESLILELPEPDAFQAALRRAGVSESSRIVVYWGEEWVTPTARVVFTLDWAGLGDRTALLDGGLTAWKAAGG